MFDKLQVEIKGESHSPNISGKVSGLPKGYPIDLEELKDFLKRRASNDFFTTPRHDSDDFSVSGLNDKKTTDEAIEFIIENKNVKSKDYDKIKVVPRPSHADYPCYVKYGNIPSGGGKYSGRMTAPLTLVGGVAKQILFANGIEVKAKLCEIGGIKLNDGLLSEEAIEKLKSVQKAGDSLGGKIKCEITGLPIGLGDALFEGFEGKIAANIFAIPAVKGIEFGLGFKLSEILGSEANDGLEINEGKIKLKSNNAGGINGGMTNGNPVTFTVAMRPTPTIAKEQDSVNLVTMQNEKISGTGRHDVCFVPRAVVVVEAVAALSVLDEILKENLWKN
ncbi:MAG: chorismate synthase [Christensenellales bacterium]